eukprot:CAMPEP_0183299280 /NCGR_PEP_ID=MMETSP0160_2-20130417/6056_1 /TAXON_ID=2839 ORGANISM="Odontella Sinensis, Strain Grunow 1884" /NCGR_SAMPLE_ID=MMETSP0160_2 /ASSEMBLY_ACC=CAM_ASM_000250 /LENGTH=334 /DNA_ID=CAMNT_0025461491 /DNA_START=26 /DNA_END=1030 /DNA_ORIENTATION=+
MPSATNNTESSGMKAMEIFTNGRPSELIMIPKPVPKMDDVLIKVLSSALDTGTQEFVHNVFDTIFLHSKKKPIVLGWHFAGVVEAVGVKVTDIKVGDTVFGHLDYTPSQKQGSFSEYITISADKTAIKPDDVSTQVAAASTTEAVTALQAMRDLGGLSNKQKVLIIGAGGGVGAAAVQVAKNLGAHVTAVCSTKDLERVKLLGADDVVDRKKDPNFIKGFVDSFHVIFDTPNSTSWKKTKKALKKTGAYVATLPSGGLIRDLILSKLSSQKVAQVMVKPKREDLNLVGEWLSKGTLKIDVDSCFKVKDLNKAISRQDGSDKVGRVVLDVGGGWD